MNMLSLQYWSRNHTIIYLHTLIAVRHLKATVNDTAASNSHGKSVI